MRIHCYLFGCWCDPNSACPKCGAALYDCEFIQVGKLDWVHSVRRLFAGIRCFVSRRCDVCGRKYWFTRSGPCCSQKCYDQWIPF